MKKYITEDIEKWKDQWQKAMDDGIFDQEPRTINNVLESPVDKLRASGNPSIRDVEHEYWNQIYQLSRHSGDAPDIITEGKYPEKGEIENLVKTVANTSNPIEPSSVGKDQDVVPTPNFNDGKELVELSDLKVNLEKLESKLNSGYALGNKTDSIQKQIDDLKSKIDDLSDSLSNNRMGEESN